MSKPELKVVADASDYADLWIETSTGDGILNQERDRIPVGKPKDFFRVHPDQGYRRRTEIYVHKTEGQVEEQHYIIAPRLRGRIVEAREATLVAVVYRDGTPRIWPVMMPKNGRDNDAWSSARAAAKEAMSKWIKLVWQGRSYTWITAEQGYAPEPQWEKLPPWDKLVDLGYGKDGVMRSTDHPLFRALTGASQDIDASSDQDDADDTI
jgi:hypothetical protein